VSCVVRSRTGLPPSVLLSRPLDLALKAGKARPNDQVLDFWTDFGHDGSAIRFGSNDLDRNLKMRKAMFVLAAAVLAVAAATQAATVDYTVSGLLPAFYPGPHAPPDGSPHLVDGLGYPGDAVGLLTYTGTLDLTPGRSVQKINTLTWSISYTYAGTDDDWTNDANGDWLQLSFSINGARTMSFGAGPAGSLGQTGLLEVNWDNDYLTLADGLTSTFYVPGYRIDVTPLALDRTGGVNFPGYPDGTPWVQPDQDVLATFDVTAVPEPSTLALMLTAGLGVSAFAWRRRR
jgi:hypothetical protein